MALICPDVVSTARSHRMSPEVLGAHRASIDSAADIGPCALGGRAGQQPEGEDRPPGGMIVRAVQHRVRVVAVDVLLRPRLVCAEAGALTRR
jgi:hypothetical protein